MKLWWELTPEEQFERTRWAMGVALTCPPPPSEASPHVALGSGPIDPARDSNPE